MQGLRVTKLRNDTYYDSVAFDLRFSFHASYIWRATVTSFRCHFNWQIFSFVSFNATGDCSRQMKARATHVVCLLPQNEWKLPAAKKSMTAPLPYSHVPLPSKYGHVCLKILGQGKWFRKLLWISCFVMNILDCAYNCHFILNQRLV